MYQQERLNTFLIKRLNVELIVVLYSTGLVKISPYRCKAENQRLWSGIAKTQSVLAQTQLEMNKGLRSLEVMYTLFQQSGWEVRALEEMNEQNI